MNRFPIALAALSLAGCRQDAGFTKLLEPEPSAEDTSAPPEEVEVEVADEPEPTCDDPGLVPASVATVDESCRNEPEQTEFEPVIEWSMTSFATFPDHNTTTSQPAIGHFTDDNGDGMIGAGDVPDIAAVFWDKGNWCGFDYESGVLRLLSGDGSQEHWSVEAIPGHPDWEVGLGGVAIGDVDGDGGPEIITIALPIDNEVDPAPEGRHRVVAFRADGSLAWASAPRDDGFNLVNGNAHGLPTIADIDQDGTPEVLLGPGIYDGQTGATWALPTDWYDTVVPVVSDLDGDGTHEVISRAAIHEEDLSLRCRFGLDASFTAIADLDGNGTGEVVLSGARQLVIFDDQCSLQRVVLSPDSGALGAPTIADYDGDGQPEIGVASFDFYFVFEADGTELWRMPVSDRSSNQTGSSVYDFEGDGYAEVVYAGEYNLWIFSGVDGTVRMQDTSQYSCTFIEYPITVDVDGDGQVEIVVIDANGIRVVGDAANGWVPAREVWNQHAYSITNVGDDLSIPAYNQPNWPEYNSFRSSDQRFNNGDGANLVDAFAMEVDRCEIECDAGIIQLTVRAANQGLADANDGISLALYAEQADGSRTLLETIPADAAVRSSYTTEGYTLRLEMTDIPTGTLILVADDDGTGTGVIEECDEENNEVRLEDLCTDD